MYYVKKPTSAKGSRQPNAGYKRTPRQIGEYLECPGEAGYREENGIARLYREVSPNGIRLQATMRMSQASTRRTAPNQCRHWPSLQRRPYPRVFRSLLLLFRSMCCNVQSGNATSRQFCRATQIRIAWCFGARNKEPGAMKRPGCTEERITLEYVNTSGYVWRMSVAKVDG